MGLPLAEEFIPIKKESNILEVVGASFSEGFALAETVSVFKKGFMAAASENGPLVPWRELNKRYPDVDVKFNEDMTDQKALFIDDNARERRERQEIISNGDQGFATKAIGFVSSMAAQMVDPIAIVGAIATGGLLKGAGITQQISRTVFGAEKAAAGALAVKAGLRAPISHGIVTGIAENLAFNVASEVGLIIPTQLEDHQNIEAFVNFSHVVVGSIAFPIAIGGVKKILRKTQDAYGWVEKLDTPEKKHAAAQLQEAKINAGKKMGFTPEEKKLIETGEVTEAEAVKIREQANSDEANMYHNPEAAEKLKEVPDQPILEPSIQERVNVYKTKLESLKDQFGGEKNTPELIAKIEAAHLDVEAKVKDVDDMIQMAIDKCKV